MFTGYHFYVTLRSKVFVSYCIWAGLFLELENLPTSDSDAEILGKYVFGVCLSLEGNMQKA